MPSAVTVKAFADAEGKPVTGIEPLVTGKFLMPHAARIAILLAKKKTYRWRVEDGAEQVASLRSWIAANGVGSPFWTLHGGSSVIHVAHDRPASLEAANWMCSDLKRLSLLNGTFPQLSR